MWRLENGDYVPELTFENFLRIKRTSTTGSAEDLLARLKDEQHLTPRQLSMLFLAYGSAGSTSLRDEASPIPKPWFKRLDAGPNVIVVCSPNNLEDVALLWNLRSALGDRSILPAGVLAEQATQQLVERLAFHELNLRNGFPARLAYLTSCSVSVERLSEIAARVSGDKVGLLPVKKSFRLGGPARGFGLRILSGRMDGLGSYPYKARTAKNSLSSDHSIRAQVCSLISRFSTNLFQPATMYALRL